MSGCIVSGFGDVGEVAHPVPKLIQAAANTIPEIKWPPRFINFPFLALIYLLFVALFHRETGEQIYSPPRFISAPVLHALR
jgi:hypothetical protein